MSTPTVMNTLTTTTSEEHAVLITEGVTEPKSVVRLDPAERVSGPIVADGKEGKCNADGGEADNHRNHSETKTAVVPIREEKADEPFTFSSSNNIVFMDPLGGRWTFPYEASKTWNAVKELVKLVYIGCILPERYAEYLDSDKEGPELSFCIVRLKPDESRILSQHWEKLVSPGWEFTIQHEGDSDIFDQVRKEKAEKKLQQSPSADNGTLKDGEVVQIAYVAKCLVPDDEGDLILDSEQRLRSRITNKSDFNTQNFGSILEEHREVICNRNSSAPILERVNSIGIPVLYIRSRILLDALGAVVGFQSSPDVLTSKRGWRSRDISSSLEDGRIVYPFTDLYHYRQRLLEYREEVKETHDPEYSETCREHIDVLDRYLLEEPPIDLNKLEVMLHQTNPKVTFASICFLLKPGSDVYVREHGNLAAYVVESCEGGPQWTSPESLARAYRVYVWNLNFDGRVLTRSVKKVTIAVFDGEREIRELPVFPAEHYSDDDPQRPLRQQLIERGRHFVQMMRKPALREYSGPSRLQGIREYNRARVVIDHTGQPWNLRQVPYEEQEETDIYIPVTYEESVTLGERTRVPRCTCDACRANDLHAHSVQRRQFDDYDDIDLASTEELTDHQYMLCGPLVYGFVLKDRVWDVLDVSRLQAPQIQKNIIDMLVMRPESNKQMIKAICEIYGGSYAQPYSSDFIHGKGEGQILLLHGPPGTGKTLTAESVAEYTGRPLLSLTAADLGQEPETLEENLLRFFRDAKKWNAVVILDEADVYLEARSTHDLGRNSIVSIFLRALDYFQGILFLTTNRVGSFDEAFMSRIHVQIGYDPLDDESRQQIWENHFKKLTRNRETNGQEIRCSFEAKEYIRKSKELQSLKWNGREIRNAFQTAVALACYQAKQEGDGIPEITDIHFRRVVAMSQNFKSYLRSFQPDVASVAFLRNDKVKAAGSSLD